ncbi:MAG: hypothetical protein N3I35_11250 [Clostridia bacterium]|nr:hypothetical protein [Clostridia bacterium]
MTIIIIKKKLLKIVTVSILLLALGIGIFTYSQNSRNPDSLEMTVYENSHPDKDYLLSFLASPNISVQEEKQIEIFDVSKGAVIKKVKRNTKIQDLAESYLNGITGVFIKASALPKNGFIVRIPLNPSIEIKTQWLSQLVNEVFLIFPNGEKPYLLVLDYKFRPLFYNFEGNTDKLLKTLDFSLN